MNTAVAQPGCPDHGDTPRRVWFGGVRHAFPKGKAGRKQYHAFCRKVFRDAPSLIQKDDRGGYRFASEAVIDRGDYAGKTVGQLSQSDAFRRIPKEMSRASVKHQAREEGRRLIRAWDLEFSAAHQSLGITTCDYFREFKRTYRTRLGEYNLKHGTHLKLGRAAVLALRAKIAANCPTDSWDRCARPTRPRDPRLCETVRKIYLAGNRHSETEAFTAQRERAVELGIEPLSRHQVRKEIDNIPHGTKVFAREKRRTFRAKAVPKMTMDYAGLAAGDWWCLDGRQADVMIRVPDAKGGWRPMRPVVTGVLDVRSRKFLAVDVSVSESAVGILRGIKRALAVAGGAPKDVTKDNGRAYRKAGGVARRHVGGSLNADEARIGGFFVEVGTCVHTSLNDQGWSKIIEPQWRLIKRECDRWHRSFWGGSPAERPDQAEKLVRRHPDELPTLGEFRNSVELAVERINAMEYRKLGGLTPNLMFEQFRGAIRHVDPATVDLVACPLDAYADGRPKPHKVGQNGVSFRGLLYELSAARLVKLQGRTVFVRSDLDHVGCIRLCDKTGKPIATARNQRLIQAGCTEDDFREGMRKKARYTRLVKAYMPSRDYLDKSSTGQILAARRDRALADEAELRKTLPAPAQPPVTVVRPDLAAACRDVECREAACRTRAALEPSQVQPVRSGFERLAEIAVDEERIERTAAAEPTNGQRFARLNYEPDEAEMDAVEPRRTWGAAG